MQQAQRIPVKELMQIYQNNSFLTRLHAWIRLHTCPFLAIEELVPKKGVIVDYGCGHGLFAHLLWHSSQQRVIYGFDIHQRKIEEADKTQKNGKRIIFFDDQNNAAALVKEADCIVVLDVLCYLSDQERRELLENFYHQFNSKTILVIKDINKSLSLKYLWTYLQEMLFVKLLKVTRARELNFFESKYLFKLLQDIGFTVEKKDISKGYLYPHTLFVCRKS